MSCQHNCGACGSCGGGELLLTPAELSLLERLAQTPFLPVGKGEYPVFLEEAGRSPAEWGAALLALEQKGLIRLDYDLPLKGCGYKGYEACSLRGSMALTARGQDVVEQIEIQGIEG
ncbi:hypothetical protein [uncultured Oscillibacter sp.]|uniref:hypothetical protein n=1 Tax=uncultured Oscillibacter sp. TaxID=876091 RepID=UPI00261A94FF|nr:hypothetical protein [uncultured Oscillibacter sp.]